MAGVCCRMKGLYKPAKQGKTVENIHHYEKKKRRELINKHTYSAFLSLLTKRRESVARAFLSNVQNTCDP